MNIGVAADLCILTKAFMGPQFWRFGSTQWKINCHFARGSKMVMNGINKSNQARRTHETLCFFCFCRARAQTWWHVEVKNARARLLRVFICSLAFPMMLVLEGLVATCHEE